MRKAILASVLLAGTTLAANADTFVTLGGQQWNITNTTNATLTNAIPSGNRSEPALHHSAGINPSRPTRHTCLATQVIKTACCLSSGTIDDKTLEFSFLQCYQLQPGSQTFRRMRQELVFTVGIDVSDVPVSGRTLGRSTRT
jgi:hypothetical protein